MFETLDALRAPGKKVDCLCSVFPFPCDDHEVEFANMLSRSQNMQAEGPRGPLWRAGVTDFSGIQRLLERDSHVFTLRCDS